MRAVSFAMPWDVQGFLSKALSASHPMDDTLGVERQIHLKVFWASTSGKSAIMQHRRAMLKELEEYADKVKDSEANLHDKLPDEFKEVLKNKKFLLFKHAIEKANYEDKELPGRMVAGFQICGKLESSNDMWQARKLERL